MIFISKNKEKVSNSRPSHVATMALYSTSVLESATIRYFLLLHDMALLSSKKTNMEVDHLSVVYSAESAPMYPLSRIGVANL